MGVSSLRLDPASAGFFFVCGPLVRSARDRFGSRALAIGEARNRLVRPMWKTSTAVALAALVAAACAAPAAADGQRGWRSRAGAWPVGAITARCWRDGYGLLVCW